MSKHTIEVRLTSNLGKIDCPSSRAMDDIMQNFTDAFVKHLKNRETKFLDILPEALIVMVTNNIFMNLFLQFYSGSALTLLEDAETIADNLKTVFIDCVQKVFLEKVDKSSTN